MLTETHLRRIMPNASESTRARYLQPLWEAMQEYQIVTLARAAAFLAQIAHESGELQFMQEIWGPTAAQKRYEPPSSLAKSLGNTEKGDGKRFKGRGPIQITGRANYETYGRLLNVDLIVDPNHAAMPDVAFRIAGLYWAKNGLNSLADAGNFRKITQRINGGQNGAAHREQFFAVAKEALAGDFPAVAPAGAAMTGTHLSRGFSVRLADAGRKRRTARPATQLPVMDARADTLDFRDMMYRAALIEVPTHIPLGDYIDHDVPILDQGDEGACTGFALATVANYLLLRRRVVPDNTGVSPYMFYHLARRYDEWPGEDYSGSSARGALKGWLKHGACSSTAWKKRSSVNGDGLTEARVSDARKRPLGAYFRVNHKDLVAMHSAIAEVGVLFATCVVHEGWSPANVGQDGFIEQRTSGDQSHAFAIVAYDEHGFWLQNSWGADWGRNGFGRITYDDWLQNGTDVWVARLGAPVVLRQTESMARAHADAAGQTAAYSYADLRPHLVSVGNNGVLKAGGDYGSTRSELERVFAQDIPRAIRPWKKPRLLLYAHGGLVGEQAAVQRVSEYRPALMMGEVYPLAFLWHSDYWTSLTSSLEDAVRKRRPEGVLDETKDFMLDRLDDALEPLARGLSGKLVWDEMKENARKASQANGAAALVVDQLKALMAATPGLELHLVGHSAGSIFHAPLLGLLAQNKLPVASCTLWAPACTMDDFDKSYVPALKSGALKKLTLFVLSDEVERDDNCAGIYHKSLLYLVSNAFEAKPRIPVFRKGIPLLGMARCLDEDFRKKIKGLDVSIVVAPNDSDIGKLDASSARHHGDFDDDEKTVTATFARILGTAAPGQAMHAGMVASTLSEVAAKRRKLGSDRSPAFQPSTSWLREQRHRIDLQTRL